MLNDRMLLVGLIAGICCLAACGQQQNSAAQPAGEAVELISQEEILQDVHVLSDDDMEGRAPGTAGGDKAAQFIAERFKENGLSPVDGSYFQSVKLVGMKKNPERSNLTIHKEISELSYRADETLTYWSTAQEPVVEINEAPLIFVGYGVEAPEHDWDDYKGFDVKGKVLLFLNDDPQVSEDGKELFKGETRTYYGRWTYKFEQAMERGAAGALMIHTTPSASYPFSVVQNSGAEEHFALDLPGSGYQVELLGWIDEATSELIAQNMGTDLAGLFEMGKSRDFEPQDTGYRINARIETEIRRVETQNVIGMIEGSDPELKEQVIVFSAHYDHLGVNENLEGDDKIFNGAWDNALGTACIINLGKAFSALDQRPKRSLLFLACAAEESGLLGSQWFVKSPPFSLRRIVANFNVDMPQVFGVTRDIRAIGLKMNSLGEALRQVAARYQVEAEEGSMVPVSVMGDPNPQAGSFYRSDQVNFAKAGIPALYLNPGKDFVTPPKADVKEYRRTRYHQVADEVDEVWDLSGCERDMRIFFETALQVANDPKQPRWNEGNEFEEEWNALYGGTN